MSTRATVLFLAATVGVLAGAARADVTTRAAYVNPTAGAAVALQIPGMHRAQVRRDIVYERVAGERLRLDLYTPRGASGASLPVVLIGGPSAYGAGRDSGQKVGWAQLVAAKGMAAAVFDTRADNYLDSPQDPSTDVRAAMRFITTHAEQLGIDARRMCTLGFSIGTAPWHLWAAMKTRERAIRCNAVWYGVLDFSLLTSPRMAPRNVAEYSAITYLKRDGAHIAPMLLVKAGRDEYPGIPRSMDRFAALAHTLHAPVTLLAHPTAPHAFDVGHGDARTRTLMTRTLDFLRAHLR